MMLVSEQHIRTDVRTLRGQAFPPEEYQRVCDLLVTRERRRLGGNSPLEELLPSAAQVRRITGSWEAALALVGLATYEQRAQRVFRHRGSMPVVDAVALFVSLNQRFPSYPVMSAWAREADIRLQTPRGARGGWWAAVLDDVAALLQDQGLAVPAERPKAGRPRKGTDRSYVLPDEPLDAAAPGDTYWDAERILAVLRPWERDLPASAEPTMSRYRRDQRDHPEWPAPETVRDHGPWEMLRDEAVRRNTLVARGHPDSFLPLPARANRGEEARRQARAVRIEHEPGHRKRADGARVRFPTCSRPGCSASASSSPDASRGLTTPRSSKPTDNCA